MDLPPNIDWQALSDPDIQKGIETGQKIFAIKLYIGLTGVRLKEAKEVIEYVMEQSDQEPSPSSGLSSNAEGKSDGQ